MIEDESQQSQYVWLSLLGVSVRTFAAVASI